MCQTKPIPCRQPQTRTGKGAGAAGGAKLYKQTQFLPGSTPGVAVGDKRAKQSQFRPVRATQASPPSGRCLPCETKPIRPISQWRKGSNAPNKPDSSETLGEASAVWEKSYSKSGTQSASAKQSQSEGGKTIAKACGLDAATHRRAGAPNKANFRVEPKRWRRNPPPYAGHTPQASSSDLSFDLPWGRGTMRGA